MFNFLDPYVSQALPHIQSTARIAHSQSERIIARLDAINEAVQSEEFLEIHSRQPFTLAIATPVEMRPIPTGEVWELEVVTAYAPALTPIITIRDALGGTLLYADTFTGAVVRQGLGLAMLGGFTPWISSEVAGAIVTCQFKRRRLKQGHPTRMVGEFDGSDLMNGQPYGERDADGRHVNTTRRGHNIIGPMAHNGRM